MARGFRYHDQFRQDLRERVVWLRRNRPPQQIVNLRQALATFVASATAFPGRASELERRGTVSYRVSLLGSPLPYLVYYSFDEADDDGPISLLMLLHEAQDRDRFDPSHFE